MQLDTRLSEISLDGFQVVSGQMFAHLPRKSDATCTLWPTSISFSKQAIVLLNNCEHIRIEINPQTRGLLVVPVTSKDQDGIRWVKSVKSPAARKIECKSFASQLYDTWGWNKNLVYRATGRLFTADNKVLMLFDFANPESWKSREAGGKNV